METVPEKSITKLIIETENTIKLLDENEQEAIRFLPTRDTRNLTNNTKTHSTSNDKLNQQSIFTLSRVIIFIVVIGNLTCFGLY
jgi:hypothetical protein